MTWGPREYRCPSTGCRATARYSTEPAATVFCSVCGAEMLHLCPLLVTLAKQDRHRTELSTAHPQTRERYGGLTVEELYGKEPAP